MLNELDPRFFLSIFLRRFPVFLLTAIVIFSGFAAAAVLLPATYTSRAKILVESQQIPQSLVQSTVTSQAVERLRVIEQRLMTRENLLDIASQFGVFRSRQDLSPTDIVEAMRKASSFEVASLGGGRGGGVAMAFTISFSAAEPGTAARVTGEYVTRILESNLRLRTGRAADTYEFFDQETQRLGGELSSLEAQIVEFKRANQNSLPETLGFRTNQLDRIQQRIQLLDRETANLQERRKQLVEITKDPANLLGQDRGPTETEKAKMALERELEVRSALLSDEHPEIRAIKTRIATLDRLMESEKDRIQAEIKDSTSRYVAGEMARVNQEIEQIDTQLSQKSDELAGLERQETELERSVAETPNTQMGLNALQRNYANLQQQYEDARSKLAVSATGEQLELKQQAERFEVIEQATVPESPDKPDRMMILALGFGGGTGAGLAMIVLLEFLNKAIRRPGDIVSALDIQPLAVIPYIYTDYELRRRSRIKWTLIVLLLGGLTAALVLIHFYYLPIDLLARQVMEKTQLDTLLELIRTRLKI